jgi:hypothetical protein
LISAVIADATSVRGSSAVAVTVGWNGTLLQPVGVNSAREFETAPEYDVTVTPAAAGVQEVGLVMNALPPATPFSVSVSPVMSSGMPVSTFGTLVSSAVRPKSLESRMLIGDSRKTLPRMPPIGRTTMPSRAGSSPPGSTL